MKIKILIAWFVLIAGTVGFWMFIDDAITTSKLIFAWVSFFVWGFAFVYILKYDTRSEEGDEDG